MQSELVNCGYILMESGLVLMWSGFYPSLATSYLMHLAMLLN